MTRTTLDLDPAVLRDLRQRAKRQGKSMGQVASEVLVRALTDEPAQPARLRWVSHDLGEPLIDIDDKDELYRILDEG